MIDLVPELMGRHRAKDELVVFDNTIARCHGGGGWRLKKAETPDGPGTAGTWPVPPPSSTSTRLSPA
jgi:hypothetical protein